MLKTMILCILHTITNMEGWIEKWGTDDITEGRFSLQTAWQVLKMSKSALFKVMFQNQTSLAGAYLDF